MFILLCLLPISTLAFHCQKPLTMDRHLDRESDHCYTSLEIDYSFAMTYSNRPVYLMDGKVKQGNMILNTTEVENVIIADGWNNTHKLLITANGSLPGPEIILYQHQKITIVVKNNLINEAVTIHWHGIDQFEWPAMDGVAYVSQCPITPGQSFNYTFRPMDSGSYWYHSHMGNQRDAGLYGAFIVRRREPESVPFPNQRIVLLEEYNHNYGPVSSFKLEGLSTPEESHAILINGKGFYSLEEPTILTTFDLLQRDNSVSTILFRIISAASGNTFLLEIPGLRLKIVESDGWPVNPFVVDKLIIYPAERYDFEIDLICANQSDYKLIVSNPIHRGEYGLAKITNLPVNINRPLNCSMENTVKVLNCPHPNYLQAHNETCIRVSQLTSRLTSNGSVSAKAIKTHFLNFAFVNNAATINGRKFIWPTVSALSQPNDLNTDCSKCSDEIGCECSHSIDLESGTEVIMVLSNLGKNSGGTHPIHMHGHTFEVLKMELDEKETSDINCSRNLANKESNCNAPFWANPSWIDTRYIPGINLINPLRKDTIIVPHGGYVIIRINATNPGVWFMHCHIDRHMMEGMALMLNESYPSILENKTKYNIPDGLPTCHSFLQPAPQPSLPQKQQNTDTSSLRKTITVLAVFVAILGIVLVVLCIVLLRNRPWRHTTDADSPNPTREDRELSQLGGVEEPMPEVLE